MCDNIQRGLILISAPQEVNLSWLHVNIFYLLTPAVCTYLTLLCAGKAGCRDQTLLLPENAGKAPAAHSPPGQTGEKDWLHANSVSYDPVRDQVAISLNTIGEIIIVDHGTTMVLIDYLLQTSLLHFMIMHADSMTALLTT